VEQEKDVKDTEIRNVKGFASRKTTLKLAYQYKNKKNAYV